jgi:hypothetical protein
VHWIAPSEKDTANARASEQEIPKQLIQARVLEKTIAKKVAEILEI